MFTKKDLKNGDVVKKRNGEIEILVMPLGTFVCDDGHFNVLSDIRDDLTNHNGEQYDIVAVRRPTEVSHCRFYAFKYELGDLVYYRERDTKPLYNGKVVCIKVHPDSHSYYTVGKIYQFKDGRLTCNDGTRFPMFHTVHSFEEFNDWSGSEFIEIKE